jgi:hypothetical protein
VIKDIKEKEKPKESKPAEAAPAEKKKPEKEDKPAGQPKKEEKQPEKEKKPEKVEKPAEKKPEKVEKPAEKKPEKEEKPTKREPEESQKIEPAPIPQPTCCPTPYYEGYYGGCRCCVCGQIFGYAVVPPWGPNYAPPYDGYRVYHFSSEEDPSASTCTIM